MASRDIEKEIAQWMSYIYNLQKTEPSYAIRGRVRIISTRLEALEQKLKDERK